MTLLMVMLAVNFTACSNDDEEEQTIIEQANLIGKWQSTWEKIHKVENGKEVVISDEAYTNGLWEFKADGTCIESRADGGPDGECVALGMLPMIESKALQKRVRAVYRRLGLPTRTTYDKEKVLAEMLHDKKAQSGQITIIKVPGLGCWRAETIPVEGLRPLLGIEE